METLEQIKELTRNANAVYTLLDKDVPKWKANPKHYDKTDWKFNGDHRFKATGPVCVFFSSYEGVYGDSGCSTSLRMSGIIFKRHLVKYLNDNKEQIMRSIAASIHNEAVELKVRAEEELNSQLRKLSELEQIS